MTNLEKFESAILNSLEIPNEVLSDTLEYNSIPEWDSVGHMSLVGDLEEVFDIMVDTDDIIAMSSIGEIKIILKKYNIEF